MANDGRTPPPPDGERCILSSGCGWRCRKARVESRSYCEAHLKMFELASQTKMAGCISENGARGEGKERGRMERMGYARSGDGSAVTGERIQVKKGEVRVSDKDDEREMIERKRCYKSDSKESEMRKRMAMQKGKANVAGYDGLKKREEEQCQEKDEKPLKKRGRKERKRSDGKYDRSIHRKRGRKAAMEGVVRQIGSEGELVWQKF